jgi:site-specific recombinase XerD
MPTPLRLQLPTEDPGNVLAPHLKDYREALEAGRFKVRYRRQCLANVIHFGRWLNTQKCSPGCIDEAVVGRFLSEHLPHCACPRPVSVTMVGNRAALNHLVRLLRTQGVVALPADDEIALELTHFSAKMAEVWGLSAGTRDSRYRIIGRLLRLQFGSGAIDPASLSPTVVRSFVLGDAARSTSTIHNVGGAVRCYLRYRELRGDKVANVLRAVPRPAYRRETTLPVTLSDDELQQLFRSFDAPCPSRRRGYAIVRCLADLGLRSSEAARLRLDDIDWRAGTLTLSAGKGRRADTLPLPAATGEAIADYLLHERPKTTSREIFVRHVAPLGEPVGRRVIQRSLHAAYRRLGWDRTRVHILRHTLASRLINAGAPMKQSADVLRHRSIVTSAIYTRVDVTRLSAVALPWPGSSA